MLVKFLFFIFLIYPFALKAEWIEYDTLKNGNWSMIWNSDIIETKKSKIWIYHGTNYIEPHNGDKSVMLKSVIDCSKNNKKMHIISMEFFSDSITNEKSNNKRTAFATNDGKGFPMGSGCSGFYKLCDIVCKRYFNID